MLFLHLVSSSLAAGALRGIIWVKILMPILAQDFLFLYSGLGVSLVSKQKERDIDCCPFVLVLVIGQHVVSVSARICYAFDP